MSSEFDLCLVLNARMASRAVTRLADRRLRQHGITAAQFSILTSLWDHPGRSVTQMASAIAMDRSTLSRNLALLERNGLVTTSAAERGNGRVSALSETGRQVIGDAIPAWREQQSQLRAALDDPEFSTVIAALRQLARL
ncbi:MarR family transcriptional regulator [Devosia sp. J2-20]|jgi:DNA-binding MarR family transcriptional regulator|uniref:MarR family winged helix-turn-helix transcriptional regulator n=1 Tax=Devosia sp. J2-20 TaxID=3026161 RepID=UPI00249B5BFF|nr:MarR family transcriptional regulator [Devosia sp. J2-20]WDQ98957.1 MarR family transcriptional regulator [Devosia sp. J2-20]